MLFRDESKYHILSLRMKTFLDTDSRKYNFDLSKQKFTD